jgi:hypothetical protein
MNSCEACGGTGRCKYCDGNGERKKPQGLGPLVSYEMTPCGVCFGSGLCVACQRQHSQPEELPLIGVDDLGTVTPLPHR